jgi:hypothetical protein
MQMDILVLAHGVKLVDVLPVERYNIQDAAGHSHNAKCQHRQKYADHY